MTLKVVELVTVKLGGNIAFGVLVTAVQRVPPSKLLNIAIKPKMRFP